MLPKIDAARFSKNDIFLRNSVFDVYLNLEIGLFNHAKIMVYLFQKALDYIVLFAYFIPRTVDQSRFYPRYGLSISVASRQLYLRP